MSLERDIKETLGRRAGDVTPSPAAWSRVERRVRGTHRMRLLTGSLAAAVAVATAAVAVPKVLERPAPTFVAPGPDDGTANWLRYRDETEAYRLLFPPDWVRSMFEGSGELRPPGFPASAAGEPTFFVEVQRWSGSDESGAVSVPGLGADVGRPKRGELNGRAYERVETSAGERRSVQYKVDWTGLGCPPEASDCSEPATLRVEIVASTEELWRRYGSVGEQIVLTIEPVYPGGRPTETGPMRARRGAVAEGITYDALTSGLVRFMDARLEGGLAEFWLGPEAERQFRQRRDPETGLYASGQQVWLDYEVRERADADANSAEFTVFVHVQPSEGDTTTGFTETIGVGPGTTSGGNELPAIIRFSRFLGTEAAAQPGSS